MKKDVSGVTLLELLIVIAIIALLAALLLPVIQAARYQAGDRVCLNNMRQILVALNLYRDDYQEYPHNRIKAILPYVKSTDIFVCPVKKDPHDLSVSAVMEGIPNLSYRYAGVFTDMQEFLRAVRPLDSNHGLLACVWHPRSNLQHWAASFAPHVRRGHVDGSVKTVLKRKITAGEMHPRLPEEGANVCFNGWILFTNAICPPEYCHRDTCIFR